MLKQVQHDGRFANAATQLCGQCAVLLGWRPHEFWHATPAELACVLAAYAPREEAPPDAVALQKLMELFPDAPTAKKLSGEVNDG